MRIIAFTLVLCALALSGCGSFSKKNKAKKDALTKKTKVDLRDTPVDMDFDAFLGRLRKAVAAKDMQTIASMMTSNFGYQNNPPLEGDGVFKHWDENNLWPEIEGILSEKFVEYKGFRVAPPQFADESLAYDGYRAGIRRVDGAWKFAYFVSGR